MTAREEGSSCKELWFKRFIADVSQWLKNQNPSTPLRVTINTVGSSCKGLDSHWNTYFKSSYRTSQTTQSTASNSALAIADSRTEIKAEPLEASGEAVAFCYFFAKESCVSMLEGKRNNKKPAKKVIGTRGHERREYHWKSDFQRFTTYLNQYSTTQNPSTPLRVTGKGQGSSCKESNSQRCITKLSLIPHHRDPEMNSG
ncbi:hypothetical protein [Pedobacter cryophilus]|uniref:Uncharacterized protein n=1 Tax=Pedobacter cryophilus TaxID=2571271 RepID=A0A4U1BZK7_9SPHI|nr:hypothetical protein [Pedobacter cryophilus]TKB98652.1 hypothetical protein FA046_05910 [Pedobacter cryophilus]